MNAFSKLTKILTPVMLSLSLVFMPVNANALTDEQAVGLVNETVDGILYIEEQPYSVDERGQAFRDLLEDKAETDRIARFAVGSTWRQMSPAQQERYIDLFATYVSRTYAAQFGGIQTDTSGFKIDIVRTVDGGKKGIFVISQIMRPSGVPVSIEWRISDRGGAPRIIDLTVEGVSMLITQKSEFTSMLDSLNYDVEAFLTKLAELAAK